MANAYSYDENEDVPQWSNPDDSAFWQGDQNQNADNPGDWTTDPAASVVDYTQYSQEYADQQNIDQMADMPPVEAAPVNPFMDAWNTFWGWMGNAPTQQYDYNDVYKTRTGETDANQFSNPYGQDMSTFSASPQEIRQRGDGSYYIDAPTRVDPNLTDYQGPSYGVSNSDYYAAYYAKQNAEIDAARQRASALSYWNRLGAGNANYNNTPEQNAAAYDYNTPRPVVTQYQGPSYGIPQAEYDAAMRQLNPPRYDPNMPNYKGPVYGISPSRYDAAMAAARAKLKPAPTAGVGGYKPASYGGGGGGGGGYYPRSSGGGGGYTPRPYAPTERETPTWYLNMMNWRR